MKESYLLLAEGFEEIEALTPVDVLRRAGMNVKTVSITGSRQVKGAHGVGVNADLVFDPVHFSKCDWLILPGGMPGASNLYEFSPLRGILKNHKSEGRHIAAICAAPAVVLGQLGLLRGEEATCYPGFEQLCEGAKMVDTPVVVSNNLVLGNGPANALVWALTIVKEALGEKEAINVATGMLRFPNSTNNLDFTFG